MPYADNKGVKIYYEIEGNGPPLLMMHGLMGTHEWYGVFGYVEALKKDYQLILVDARGHGKSDQLHDPQDYLIEKRVADLVSVLDDMGIEKAHYFGYSMGGQEGWSIGKYAPNRFSSVIIGGMSPYQRDPAIPDPDIDDLVPMLKKGNEALVATFEEWWQQKVDPVIERTLMEADNESFIARLLRSEYVDRTETMATSTLPCLVYCGELDPEYFESKKGADELPNASFFSLPDLDHDQVYKRSDLVLPHIRKFLKEQT